MILFLYGEDGFRVNHRRRVLQQAFVKKYPQAEVFVFDFEDQGTQADVRRATATVEQGLFSTRKLLIFLHPMSLGGEEEALLLEFLKAAKKDSASPVTLLFVEPGKIKKTQPVAKFLLKGADKTEAFEKMSEAEAASYIKRELSAIDSAMSFSTEGLKTFLQVTAAQSARMRSEVEKLASFKPEGVIEKEDVLALARMPSESTIFEALDSLGRGEKGRALALLSREATKPEGVFPVFAMCAWYVRTMLLVRDAYDRGLHRVADIAGETRLAPFVVQKSLARIGDFPPMRLKQGIVLLADIDRALKSGATVPDTALDMFVWKF